MGSGGGGSDAAFLVSKPRALPPSSDWPVLGLGPFLHAERQAVLGAGEGSPAALPRPTCENALPYRGSAPRSCGDLLSCASCIISASDCPSVVTISWADLRAE